MFGLYRWVFDQFAVLHGDDIDGLNELVREANLTMSSGAWSDGAAFHSAMQSMQERFRNDDSAPD
jgi:hypothetical protein